MNDMIERVARAIWNIRREEEDRCDMELEDMGVDHPVWIEARDAITAMLEPTEAMNKAGIDAWSKSPMAVVTQYRAMINAALGNGEPE